MGLSILNPENFQQPWTVDDNTCDPELPGVAETEKFSDQLYKSSEVQRREQGSEIDTELCVQKWGCGWRENLSLMGFPDQGRKMNIGLHVNASGLKWLPGVRCWEVLWGYLTKETWIINFTEWKKTIEQRITSYPEMRELRISCDDLSHI